MSGPRREPRGQRPNYCRICSGRIIRSRLVGGWIHVDEEDWVDKPHQAEPRPR